MYSSAALISLVLLGAVALTVTQPPPPSIAEFAPQAVEQIEDAPDEQASDIGSAAGAEDPDDPESTPTPPPGAEEQVIDVPRVYRCIGDPPRQTEDPQSPPCVPYWEGDNGGETTRGVTADEIRVALPILFLEDEDAIRLLGRHFNMRYQFYGRKLRLMSYEPRGNLAAHPNPEDEQADAVWVDDEIAAFASLGTGIRYGAEHHYHEELARREILSVGGTGSLQTEERYRRFAPYVWSVGTGVDTMMRGYGEFVCRTLADQPPSYAGPDLAQQPERTFGILTSRADDGTISDIEPLRSELARCGVTPVEQEHQTSPDDAQRYQNAQNATLSLKLDGVTSVLCWCQNGDLRESIMAAASSQGYYPEWVVSSYGGNDLDSSFRHDQAPQDQSVRVLGAAFRNKLLPAADMPWYWALKEADPGYGVSSGAYYHLASRYAQMLVLASGIQMAGPDLTAETFAEALYDTRFPNPGAGGPPYYQSRVGFEGRHQSFLKGDGSMIWHNRTERGTVERSAPGAVCYIDHGTHYQKGSWPSGEQPFFDYGGPCL